MSDSSAAKPWLSIIGIGENGLAGLGDAARAALDQADIVFGAPRHLALAEAGNRGQGWPVPFDIAPVLAARGRKVAVLASGDPFWFGAGATLAEQVPREEWTSFSAPSAFSLAAARLGWRLEDTACLGLHAKPLSTLRPHLAQGRKLIVLLRDGHAPRELAAYLASIGLGASRVTVMERLGGPLERVLTMTADAFDAQAFDAPVLVAIEARGDGLSLVPGRRDDVFVNDGQITRNHVRAVTLSALAPRYCETLWDIGAGSGSIAVEWCLACRGAGFAVEPREDRLAQIRGNAETFGVQALLKTVAGRAPDALADLRSPDAVFIGGGASETVIAAAWSALRAGGRLVVNAVTLETESLIAASAQQFGGELLRMEFSHAAPLGRMRGWQPARPIVQWSVTR